MSPHLTNALRETMQNLPYDCFRNNLYSAADLYDNYVCGRPETYRDTLDAKTYAHYISAGKGFEADEAEQIARVLHDNSIARAMRSFLHYIPKHNVIGIMGGHGLKRTSGKYADVVMMSKRLTEGGALMISGGGPGAMEATHLGAWMAGHSDDDTLEAIDIMKQAPTFQHPSWLDTAFEVAHRWPQPQYKSLGLPTWAYGHEPPTPLATHTAKFFDNSIREDAILTIAYGGLVFAPGSAGTLQEVFQEATQDHYLSLGMASPMIFYDAEFWTHEIPIYRLMQHLVEKGHYKNLILDLCDTPQEVVTLLEQFRHSQAQ